MSTALAGLQCSPTPIRASAATGCEADILSSTELFDSFVDTYVTDTEKDSDLFEPGEYNTKTRSQGLGYKSLATLVNFMKFILSAFKELKATPTFLKDQPCGDGVSVFFVFRFFCFH